MGFFGEPLEDELQDKTAGGKDSKSGLVALGLFLLPALPAALFIYRLLRKKKQRLSVIAIYVFFSELALFLLWKILGFTEIFTDLVKDPASIVNSWASVLFPIFVAYSSVGLIFGLAFSAIEVRRMIKEPHRRQIAGTWMYKFEFKRTPWENIRRKKNIEALKNGVMVDAEKIPLGIDEKHDDEIVYRRYDEAYTHALVTGGTGSGKTKFGLLPLVRGDIENQESMIFIDFKNDPELASKLATWTKNNNGTFYHFVKGDPDEYDIPNSPGQSYYDPLASGGPTAKAGMLLGMREYDTNAEVYKNAMQELLSVLMPAIEIVKRKRAMASPAELADPKNKEKYASGLNWDNGNIYLLASILKGDGITDIAIACSGVRVKGHENIVENINDFATLARTKKTHQEHAVGALTAQIRTLIASECGQWLKTSPGSHAIDLYEVTRNPGNVVLFSFDSESEEDFSKNFGSLVFADIANVSARRRNNGDKNYLGIYADEFQVVPPTAVKGLLEKARGSNMAVTLSLQSLEQIVIAGGSDGEAHLKSMLDNCGNFIVFDGTQEDSAERYSKILGKHMVTTYKASNLNKGFAFSINFSNKRESVVQTVEEEKWVFEPRQFLSLTRSNKNDPNSKTTAVVINKSSFDPRFLGSEGATARRVWMIPNSDNFQDYYKTKERKFVPAKTNEDFEEEVELIVPQEYDYLASKKQAMKNDFPSTYEDEVFTQVRDYRDFSESESSDGNFQWEEMDDDEVESEELKNIVNSMVEDAILPQRPAAKKPAAESVKTSGGLPIPSALPGLPVQKPPVSNKSGEEVLPSRPSGRRRASSFNDAFEANISPAKTSGNKDENPDELRLPGL